MAVKVFLTGASGYIGGTALAAVYKAHPDYEYTLLVRSEERAKPIKEKFSKAKFVYGGLEDAELVQKAAAEADVVIHTAGSADSEDGARNIAKGIAAGHSAEKPGYWIHVSGTSILTWYDQQQKRFGEGPLPEQKYHDIERIDDIVNIPSFSPHKVVDDIVQQNISDTVRVAIVCPPTIYGQGTGPVNTRSIQVPDMARQTLEKGFAPIVGAGKTEWDNVHVQDLGDLFTRLLDASQDASKRGDPEVFGIHGYYFARAAFHAWSDIARWIAEEADKQGYLPGAQAKSVTQQEVLKMDGVANASWGSNSKGVAERAKKYLGWEPKAVPLKDTIAEVVRTEAEALGLKPKEKKA